MNAKIIEEFLDACSDDIAVADRLLKKFPMLVQAEYMGEPILHWLITEDLVGGARLILASGLNVDVVDKWGSTALHNACLVGHLDCAQLLLDRGADPDIVGSTGFPVLDHAVKRGSLALVRALLAAGARADYCTDTATSIADALESSGKNRGAIVGEIEKCGWKIAGLR